MLTNFGYYNRKLDLVKHFLQSFFRLRNSRKYDIIHLFSKEDRKENTMNIGKFIVRLFDMDRGEFEHGVICSDSFSARCICEGIFPRAKILGVEAVCY